MAEYHMLKEMPMPESLNLLSDKKRAGPKDLISSEFVDPSVTTSRFTPTLNEEGTSPGGVKNSPRTASENSAYDNDKSPSSKSISHQSLTVHEDSARTRLLPEIQHTSADRCCGEEKIGLKLKYFFMAVHLVSIAFVIGMAIAMKTGSSLFSWHPFFMSLGFIFFVMQAVLIFSPISSLFTSQPRAFKVKLHWIFQSCGISCMLIGVLIIYINKILMDKPHATTWHGILGYVSVTQLVCQCVAGILLLYPSYVKNYFTLAQLKRLHATVGMLGVFLGCLVVFLSMYSKAFLNAVPNDCLWMLFAAVPAIMALAVGNQVTTAYGPKKVSKKSTLLKN